MLALAVHIWSRCVCVGGEGIQLPEKRLESRGQHGHFGVLGKELPGAMRCQAGGYEKSSLASRMGQCFLTAAAPSSPRTLVKTRPLPGARDSWGQYALQDTREKASRTHVTACRSTRAGTKHLWYQCWTRTRRGFGSSRPTLQSSGSRGSKAGTLGSQTGIADPQGPEGGTWSGGAISCRPSRPLTLAHSETPHSPE